MSTESQRPSLQSLSESEQPRHPPPPEDAGDGDEGDREGSEEEAEKPEDFPALSSPPSYDTVLHLSSPFPTPSSKKANGRRKKNPINPKQRIAAEKRLVLLNANFYPVPFSPGKTLDFSAHEQLFRALGLWAFAHLEFDRVARPDLLVHLIAYYNPSNRRSYVHGSRISVSRSDLARALSLPVKKEKANTFEVSDESAGILLEFMSNYIPYGDDMCILPTEIMQATQFVKEGVPQKVDWAGLMWVLVEKELKEAPKYGVCHCASHLQRLINHQQPQLFLRPQEPVLKALVQAEEEEVLVAEGEVSIAEDEGKVVEEEIAVEEEEDGCCDANAMKVMILEEFGNGGPQESNVELELTLGEEGNEMGGLEDCKVGEDDQWPEERDNEGFEHCLRPCNSISSEGINFQNLTKVCEQEVLGVDYAVDLSAKISNLGRLSSSDHLQAMANMSSPYAQQLNSFAAASGEILTMGIESHKNVVLNHGPNDSLYSGSNRKGQACDVEEDHFELNQPKRMRTSEPWDNIPPSFDECMEKVDSSVRRAKILYAEKDQAMVNMQVQMQYLNHILQEKEQTIQSLKIMVEEQQHWQMMVPNYEHELNLMTQMLLGYKKALKETKSGFTDYRKKHQHDDETLYKDVPGTGGLVLSARDFKKHQFEKEEAALQELLGTFGSLENVLMKFKGSEERIMICNRKLVELAGEMEQLKDRFAKCKSSSI